jgi:hypothetical protein
LCKFDAAMVWGGIELATFWSSSKSSTAKPLYDYQSLIQSSYCLCNSLMHMFVIKIHVHNTNQSTLFHSFSEIW